MSETIRSFVRAVEAQECRCGPHSGRCVHMLAAERRERPRPRGSWGTGLIRYVESILQADANGLADKMLLAERRAKGAPVPYLDTVGAGARDLAIFALWALETRQEPIEHVEMLSSSGARTHGIRFVGEGEQLSLGL